MGFSTLARGLIGQITSRFSIWTNQMNQNLRFLDSRMGGLKIIEQIATTASLPVSPSNGDSYVITSTKTVETWFADPGTWQTTQLYVPDIFLDVNESKFYYYNGSLILELLNSANVVNYDVSNSSGAFTVVVVGVPTNVTNFTINNFTTIGNPVKIKIIPDNSNTLSQVALSQTAGSGVSMHGNIYLLRDGVIVDSVRIETDDADLNLFQLSLPSLVEFIDFPVAGTYDYSIQLELTSGDSIGIIYKKLYVES